MIKRLTTTSSLLLSLAMAANAQAPLPLPYNCGFDNATQKAGWQQFRKGSNTMSSDYQFSESFSDGYTAPSAPNCLIHPYPTIGEGITDDYDVSPALNLSAGGKLSLKANIYTFTGTMAVDDSFQVILLKGNADPAMATTKTLLVSLHKMNSMNHDFRDTTGIIIPATTGNAYIAIRYRAKNNWFTIGVDDIKIVSNGGGTGIDDLDGNKIGLVLYPNPAKTMIRWNYNATATTDKMEAILTDLSGRTISTFRLKDKQLNLNMLQPGIYLLKSGGKAVLFTKE